MAPAVLKALGREDLPEEIEFAGLSYRCRRVFKNDFFAITAMYERPVEQPSPASMDPPLRVLLKVGRRASFFGIPLGWVGRWLARREAAALQRLEAVEGVPRLLGRWERDGIIREFVEGHALAQGERVPDDFHARLRELVGQIHARGMAYVDLEKCENVLVGQDGRPYLFDFQIAWYVPPRWGGQWRPMRALRRLFQEGDRYHLRKLQRRTRPDQLSSEELSASYRRPWYVRWHRIVTWPFTWLRRKILRRVDPRTGPGERGTVSAKNAGQTP